MSKETTNQKKYTNKISGKITDSINRPIAYAGICILGKAVGSMSDTLINRKPIYYSLENQKTGWNPIDL